MRVGCAIGEANAQALQRTGKGNLLYGARREVVARERPLFGRKLYLFGADHGDDLVLAVRLPIDGRAVHLARAEAHAALGLAAEEQVGRAEKRCDEARRGAGIELIGAADLEEPAEIHDADAVSEREGLLLVMRDEHRRDAKFALHLADRAAQLLADLGVESAEGLIEEQHLGLVCQSARNCNALLLTTGELRRQPFVHALERDQAQKLAAALAPRMGTHAPHAQRKLDVVGYRHMTKERVVLEHETDVALLRGHVRNVAAVQ